jgi:hypothetical protein
MCTLLLSTLPSSIATTKREHNGWNAQEHQANGAGNQTTESLYEGLQERHHLFVPFVSLLVLLMTRTRFSKANGNEGLLIDLEASLRNRLPEA